LAAVLQAGLSKKRQNLKVRFVWLTATLMIGFSGHGRISRGCRQQPEPLHWHCRGARPASPPATGAKTGPELTTAATPVEAPPPAEAARLRKSRHRWAQDFIGILAQGRAGVESPGDVHAPPTAMITL